MAAADARRLHAARLAARSAGPKESPACAGSRADLLDVDDAEVGLEDRVDQQRLREARLGLELGQQLVDVVDVPGTLDLGDHDDVELVADLGDQRREVVEHPRAVEAVHAGPELAVAEVGLGPIFTRPSRAATLLSIWIASSRLPSSTSHFLSRCPGPSPPSSDCSGRRSGSSAPGGRGSRAAGRGADGLGLEEVLGASHGSTP